MQLVVEIGLVVVDDDQQRNLVLGGGPQSVAAHHEIAVAHDRDSLAAHVRARQRHANRDRRARPNAAAAVLAHICERRAEWPQIARKLARDRGQRDVVGVRELLAQQHRDVLHANAGGIGRGRERLAHGLTPRRFFGSGAQRLKQIDDNAFGACRDQQVGGRLYLVDHVSAVMEMMIHRDVDDLAVHADAALGRTKRAAKVDPFQRQHQISLADEIVLDFAGLVEGLDDVGGMVAREDRAVLEIAHHAGAERFGQLDAIIPCRL